MKRCFFPIALIALLSCNNHPENTTSQPADSGNVMMEDKDKDKAQEAAGTYRQLPELIAHLTETETGIADPIRNIQEQNDFCNQASLMRSASWQKADERYRQFAQDQAGHKYINVFRQYGAYVILVNLNLLAESSPEALLKIWFYTDELVKSGAVNAPLISAGLSQLKEHGFSAAKIRELADSAEKQLQANSKYAEVKKSVQQYVNQAMSATRDPKYAAEDENHIRVFRLIQEAEENIHALAQ
ncbi:hypothetical protein HF324_12305 [Chitinophaga oryzae]|uniref:Uncharacterized protein n=1 Tax=Chitinophaga oryzae TaxID=2725414 RepID=A0ABX6LID2_9BACT|nr:hypothetical protein [Chitinophaga oryzae]QJB38603.1 hypothetical protein HF324_12305 [Chitinophaga oryzae]